MRCTSGERRGGLRQQAWAASLQKKSPGLAARGVVRAKCGHKARYCLL
jgi:hypothetical protein